MEVQFEICLIWKCCFDPGIGPALSLVSNQALQFMFYEELKSGVRDRVDQKYFLCVRYLIEKNCDFAVQKVCPRH
jgi:hypothetical protein